MEGNVHSKAPLPLLSLLCLSVCMSHIPSVPLWSQEGRYGIETEIWAVLVQPMLAPSVDQRQRFLLLLEQITVVFGGQEHSEPLAAYCIPVLSQPCPLGQTTKFWCPMEVIPKIRSGKGEGGMNPAVPGLCT